MRTKLTGISVLSAGALLLPFLADAQTLITTLALVNKFLTSLVYIFITLAIVVFFWGLIKYLWGDGAEGKTIGLQIMMYGIITIFVMVSMWGIIQLLQSTFGTTRTAPIIPQTIQLN